nr:unnamed protein product [Callosobruchus analis]
MPNNPGEWSAIANNFDNRQQFPHCFGVMDGKHIVLQCPFSSHSEYYNYKGSLSIVLMALVDSNYNFIYADVGCQGRISDGGVFRNSKFHHQLQDIKIKQNLPYVFLADDTFELTTRILKPYPGVHKKGSVSRIFNNRLSRARIIVENVFGIMTSTFRVLRKPMLLQQKRATLITLTCAYLHIF